MFIKALKSIIIAVVFSRGCIFAGKAFFAQFQTSGAA
jgi:hypothetical protein